VCLFIEDEQEQYSPEKAENKQKEDNAKPKAHDTGRTAEETEQKVDHSEAKSEAREQDCDSGKQRVNDDDQKTENGEQTDAESGSQGLTDTPVSPFFNQYTIHFHFCLLVCLVWSISLPPTFL
jgi:hypothetical protein